MTFNLSISLIIFGLERENFMAFLPLGINSSGEKCKSSRRGHRFNPSQDNRVSRVIFLTILTTNYFLSK